MSQLTRNIRCPQRWCIYAFVKSANPETEAELTMGLRIHHSLNSRTCHCISIPKRIIDNDCTSENLRRESRKLFVTSPA